MNRLEGKSTKLPDPICNGLSLHINQSVSEMPSSFSNMCTRLTTIIIQDKVIQERSLFDFNKFVVFAISNSITQLPSSFCELSAQISDYWHYKLDRETDSDRKYSYIRLYQMIGTVNAFCTEQSIQNKVLKALDKQRENANIVRLINQYPGITYKKLLETLSVSPEDLQKKLNELEMNDFLYGRRSNSDRYYVLTNAGDALYQALETSSRNTLDGYWSYKQSTMLVFLLSFFEKNRGITKPLVVKLTQSVAALDDKAIDAFLNQVWKGEKYTRTTMQNTCGIIEYESYSDMYKPTNLPQALDGGRIGSAYQHSEEPKNSVNIYK